MKRLVLSFSLAACGSVGPNYAGTVRVTDSRLVAINPDVKTVVDADQPVFFARGSYWLFDDGQWFRANRVDANWTYVEKPPVPVRQITQPFAYVHFARDVTEEELAQVALAGGGREPVPAQNPKEPKPRPAQEHPPTAIDPTVDPTTNRL